jgi:hypothetical protein
VLEALIALFITGKYTKMSNQQNPLQKFYRHEEFTVALPSRGLYYADGIVELNDDNEVGIMPMTAADEMNLKNPDALLTGKAISELIKSCVPAVKDPQKLLSCDIEVLMIAIRRASYGDKSDMQSKCPNCGHENTYSLDLETLLNQTETLDSSYEVILPEGLTVFLSPGTFRTMNKQNKVLFENQKVQRAIGNNAITDDAALAILTSAFQKLSKLNFELISDSIVKIVFTDEDGEEQEITKKNYIDEYIANVDKSVVDKITEKMKEIATVGVEKDLDAQWVECEHKWTAPIEFNPVNFS